MVTKLSPHKLDDPSKTFFDQLFCAGKTSLEDIPVGEYAKLYYKKASCFFFSKISDFLRRNV